MAGVDKADSRVTLMAATIRSGTESNRKEANFYASGSTKFIF